jgi:hypothetical protein
MKKIAPTISSGVAGPMGVLHLPRLWQKASLSAAGKLHDDYAAAGRGFDQMLLDAFGIDRGGFLDFVSGSKPTYPQLETWVRERCGGDVDAGAVDAVNKAIIGHDHTSEVRREILDDAGVEDCGVIRDALSLNDLDDLAAFYREEIAGQ